MTLHYHFERLQRQQVRPDGSILYDEPRDYDYDYEVDITNQDIIDYLNPKHNKDWEEPMKKVLEFIEESINIDTSDFENDEYFVEFLLERYKDKALEEMFEMYE